LNFVDFLEGMSRQINQPINQVKLTNVAVVKYSHKGRRFEIACYRNKVMDYRSGFERDLGEVLQSERIFTNVGKGQFARSSELEHAFGTRDEAAIARTILERGEFQLSDLERQQALEGALSQIATQVAANCVNPETRRPYTVGQVRAALSNHPLQPHKPAKKQYLDAIKFLRRSSFPVERAKMELALRYPIGQEEQIEAALGKLGAEVWKQRSGPGLAVVHVDPSLYRDLNELAASVKGGRLEILQQVVVLDASGESGMAQPMPSADYQAPVPAPADSKPPGRLDGPDGDEEQQELLHKLESLGIVRADPSDSSSSAAAPQNRKQLRRQQKRDKKAQRRTEDAPQEAEKSDHGGAGSAGPDGGGGDDDDSQSDARQLAAGATARSCNTCGGSFPSPSLYRAHFRSDWHRFNQKLKLRGVAAVSEEEFRLCDADAFFGGPGDG
jgi:ribosome maturation protein SDO1